MEENNTATAAERVFDIAELAEQILLHADMRDVLRLQRLNKHTKALISGSLALQRKLHLIAEPGDEPKRWISCLPKHFQIDSARLCAVDVAIPGRPSEDEEMWRTMYLTQPPIKKELVQSIGYGLAVYVTNEDGITLGDVEDVAMEFWKDGRVAWTVELLFPRLRVLSVRD